MLMTGLAMAALCAVGSARPHVIRSPGVTVVVRPPAVAGSADVLPRMMVPSDADASVSRAPSKGTIRTPDSHAWSKPPKSARAMIPLLFMVPVLLHASPAAALAVPGGLPISDSAVRALLDSAFFQALSLIFVSELGDKTFFIATLLAARTSRLLTFIGSAGALAVMTVASVLIGQIFHAVPSGITGGLPIDDIVAVVSFSYFGVKSLRDAAAIEDGDTSGLDGEREEAEEELGKVAFRSGRWALIAEAFTLTAAAELGDRSQLTTIALSAAQNPFGVCLGAIVAHCIATGGAVLGGSFISKYLSEKVIGYIGGSLFIIFALTTFSGLAPQLATLIA